MLWLRFPVLHIINRLHIIYDWSHSVGSNAIVIVYYMKRYHHHHHLHHNRRSFLLQFHFIQFFLFRKLMLWYMVFIRLSALCAAINPASQPSKWALQILWKLSSQTLPICRHVCHFMIWISFQLNAKLEMDNFENIKHIYNESIIDLTLTTNRLCSNNNTFNWATTE